MKMLWQLRKLSTGENLTEPAELPENWGPLFGLEGFKDKLGDLSWVGIQDRGWFEVGPAPEVVLDDKKIIEDQIKHLLNSCNDKVLVDNTSVTKADRALWIEYRRKLKDLLEVGFNPKNVEWPKRPDVE